MSHEATNWAFKQESLESGEWRVLAILADHHNPEHGCFPSQETIAKRCNMSRRSVNTHLKKLEELRLIFRQRRVEIKTKKQLSTRYYLAFEGGFKTSKKTLETEQIPCADFAHPPVKNDENPVCNRRHPPCEDQITPPVQNLHTNPVTEPLTITSNTPPPTPPSKGGGENFSFSDEDLDDLVDNFPYSKAAPAPETKPQKGCFDDFWNAYPNKRNQQRAWFAYKNALAFIKSDDLLIAVEEFADEVKMAGTAPQYIPQAANWLRDQRWKDLEIDDEITESDLEFMKVNHRYDHFLPGGERVTCLDVGEPADPFVYLKMNLDENEVKKIKSEQKCSTKKARQIAKSRKFGRGKSRHQINQMPAEEQKKYWSTYKDGAENEHF